MKKLLIIKLGGSVITFKDSSVAKVRTLVIKRLAREIKEIYEQGYKIILVHGAGSFAHPLVKKYGIQKGMFYQEQKLGFSLTTIGMTKLNLILLNQLAKNKIPAVSLSPHSFIKRNKMGLKFETSLIDDYLDQNMVPVLFGDTILDDIINCSVISGDTIVPFLAKKFSPDKIIFLSDVDGIYESDPKKNPNAKLIPIINNQNLKQVIKSLSPSNRDDVTGEMKGKISEIKSNLKGIPVIIIGGLIPRNLIKALDQPQKGTMLQID